jgi:hypothetical protein
MEPWVWVLIAIVGVLLLFMLFRGVGRPASAGGRRTVVVRRPGWRRR